MTESNVFPFLISLNLYDVGCIPVLRELKRLSEKRHEVEQAWNSRPPMRLFRRSFLGNIPRNVLGESGQFQTAKRPKIDFTF